MLVNRPWLASSGNTKRNKDEHTWDERSHFSVDTTESTWPKQSHWRAQVLKKTKPSTLHSGYTLCPGLSHGSSLGQHGQQEMVDRGFKQNMVLRDTICCLSSDQVHNSLSIFHLPVHVFACNPKSQSPRDMRTWSLQGKELASQWNGDPHAFSFPVFSAFRANRSKKHWYCDLTRSFKSEKKKISQDNRL